MRIKNLAPKLVAALPVLKQIDQAGFESYFVGGCVRDTLLGLPIHDIDIATSAYPAEIKQLFDHTVDTGIEHGTVTVVWEHNNYEITTFRTESGYQDFRRPDKVTFVRSLSEDLKRRDFTINALAMRHTGDIIDLYDGIGDLKRHEIKAVGNPDDRFHEDALRMMRAVRFQSKLDFKIETNTEKGIVDNAQLLTKIAVERIHVEFVKLMLGQGFQTGLQTMLDTQLEQYCPEFPNFDFNKLIRPVNGRLKNEIEVWTYVCSIWQLDNSQVNRFLKKWKSSNDVKKIVNNATQLLNSHDFSDWNLYVTGKEAVIAAANVISVVNNHKDGKKILDDYNELPIKSAEDMQVDGQYLMSDLDLKPGPQIGKFLLNAQKAIIEHKIENKTDEIINFLKTF